MEDQQILIVEDNEQLRFLLEITLVQAGYDVMSADNGEQALQVVARHGMPHLALLDIHMPGINGLELAARLREHTPDLPIVFLTSISRESTVVEALEKIADDYIIKPFYMDELIVRIQRVLRRVASFDYQGETLLHVDAFLQIDIENEQARIDGHPVELTPTETKLLEILASNRGHVVPTTVLLAKVWPIDTADENRLYVAVYRLRQKLKANKDGWDYISTHSGLGYCLHPRPLNPGPDA